MIRVELQAPLLDVRTNKIIEDGFGFVRDWGLLEHLVYVAKRDNLEMEFVRLENGGEVVIDLECMEAALDMELEVRPPDSERHGQWNLAMQLLQFGK